MFYYLTLIIKNINVLYLVILYPLAFLLDN